MRQIVFGYHPDWLVAIGARIDRSRYQPSFAPLDAVDLDRFDAALPLQLDHYRELAGRDARKFVMPGPDVVALCHDKLALARFLQRAGFGRHVPEIYEGEARYPYVRKPRRGEFGEGCRIVAGPDGESARDSDSFDQACVPGPIEYALHILRFEGRIRYCQLVRYEMAGPLEVRGADNKPVRGALVRGDEAASLFEPILAALDYSGTCCINFKLQDRTPMILEINPRFGGSLVHDVTRYVDAYIDALA
jgi:hypothetical protein